MQSKDRLPHQPPYQYPSSNSLQRYDAILPGSLANKLATSMVHASLRPHNLQSIYPYTLPLRSQDSAGERDRWLADSNRQSARHQAKKGGEMGGPWDATSALRAWPAFLVLSREEGYQVHERSSFDGRVGGNAEVHG